MYTFSDYTLSRVPDGVFIRPEKASVRQNIRNGYILVWFSEQGSNGVVSWDIYPSKRQAESAAEILRDLLRQRQQ